VPPGRADADMREPERDRIQAASGECELVYERLYGKDVGVCAEREKCRDTHGIPVIK
jgi:hypothetical protein